MGRHVCCSAVACATSVSNQHRAPTTLPSQQSPMSMRCGIIPCGQRRSLRALASLIISGDLHVHCAQHATVCITEKHKRNYAEAKQQTPPHAAFSRRNRRPQQNTPATVMMRSHRQKTSQKSRRVPEAADDPTQTQWVTYSETKLQPQMAITEATSTNATQFLQP